MNWLLEETCESSIVDWAKSAELCGARQHAERNCPISETKGACFPLRETASSALRPKNLHLPEQREVS